MEINGNITIVLLQILCYINQLQLVYFHNYQYQLVYFHNYAIFHLLQRLYVVNVMLCIRVHQLALYVWRDLLIKLSRSSHLFYRRTLLPQQPLAKWLEPLAGFFCICTAIEYHSYRQIHSFHVSTMPSGFTINGSGGLMALFDSILALSRLFSVFLLTPCKIQVNA